MAITINGGTGVITGISVGGLPDGVVDSGTLAANSVTSTELATNSVDSAELIDGAIDASHLASGVGGLYASVAVISDTKAQDTGGGAATSGAWRTRDLNTEDSDVDGIVSIASNQFTLQAGTYTVEFSAPAVDVNYHQANLENTTDSLTYKGSTERAWGTSDQSTTRSMGVAVFTIAGAKVFEIQHRVYATMSYGFGLAGVSDGVEVYTIVKILKHA